MTISRKISSLLYSFIPGIIGIGYLVLAIVMIVGFIFELQYYSGLFSEVVLPESDSVMTWFNFITLLFIFTLSSVMSGVYFIKLATKDCRKVVE